MGSEQVMGTQNNPLLQTKLFVPTPKNDLIRRQSLIDHLESNLLVKNRFSRKLTLISAPAGYGKTTLVSQWLAETQCPISWLTLEAGDGDSTRFLSYLIAALQTVSPQLGETVTALLEAPQQPPKETLLTALINDLASYSEPFLLVLDDYHVIQSKPVHEMVNFLVKHLPGNIHLVITSREDPPMPLHRLQARRQSIAIRQSQLAFDAEEVSAFFHSTSDIRLSNQQASLLVARTEGWVTGLQLAALSMQSAPNLDDFIESFTGSNRYILDYFFEEVFHRQPEDIQRFLLQTAILNRICAELADAVTKREDSGTLLEQLDESNLFVVPLDQSRRWYRYHRLFSDLLRNRLRAEMKAPGRAWLEFEMSPLSEKRVRVLQTAISAPKGLSGTLYWYALMPIHKIIFSGMIRKIAERAKELTRSRERTIDEPVA